MKLHLNKKHYNCVSIYFPSRKVHLFPKFYKDNDFESLKKYFTPFPNLVKMYTKWIFKYFPVWPYGIISKRNTWILHRPCNRWVMIELSILPSSLRYSKSVNFQVNKRDFQFQMLSVHSIIGIDRRPSSCLGLLTLLAFWRSASGDTLGGWIQNNSVNFRNVCKVTGEESTIEK